MNAEPDSSIPIEPTKKAFVARIELPKSNTLERDCKWIAPEFLQTTEPVEEVLWALNGTLVAIGYFDDQRQKIIGSGVMLAPGLCLTATHVLEEMANQPLLYSFVDEKSMRIWVVEDYAAQQFKVELVPFQQSRRKVSDSCILACSPFSVFSDAHPLRFVPIEVTIPKIGERLWTIGYREKSNDGAPMIGCFLSSGLVTELYLEGRGSHLKGPCIEVGMNVYGGMSGGPVFNAAGRVVGVVSSGMEGGDGIPGPTYVTLVWPSLVSTVHSPWPQDYWPDQTAGLQIVPRRGGARVQGSVREEQGALRVKFSEQADESMLHVLRESRLLVDSDTCVSDYAYEFFSDYLETEGVKHLATLPRSRFAGLVEHRVGELLAPLLSVRDVECVEGIEDLDVKSIVKLPDGSLGVDATFNLRIVELTLTIQIADEEWHQDSIKDTHFLYDRETSGSEAFYKTWIRPYFRVTFTLNPNNRHYNRMRIVALSLPNKRRRTRSTDHSAGETAD